MNRVTIAGRLTKDIEVRYTPNGTAVGNFSIAVGDYQGKEKGEVTYFFECFGFGDRWTRLEPYLKKGTKVIIDGKLVQEQWVAQDGSKRSTVKIRIDEIDFCGSKNNGQNQAQQPQQTAAPQPQQTNNDQSINIDEEDIPF